MGDESEVTSVVIPGALQLSNPVPPPITVTLPIVARPREGKNVAWGLFALLLGLILLPFAALSVLGLFGGVTSIALGRDSFGPSFILAFGALTLLLVYTAIHGVIFTGMACTCIWDAMRSDAALEIAADGLRDRRSGVSIPWSAVRSAKLLAPFSVDLELEDAGTNWQNPFRLGVALHRYRPVPNHVIIPAGLLDVPAHVVGYTILTLVQLNGGRVITRSSPYGAEMYPRLIAQKVM